MAQSTELEVAGAGDSVRGIELQPSIDALRAMANAMDDLISKAPTVNDAQEISRCQQQLRTTSRNLIIAQIDLLVGEAKITADHINGATAYASDVIVKIADWRKRIAQAGALVEFFGVVATGNGGQILKAAVRLKSSLDA